MYGPTRSARLSPVPPFSGIALSSIDPNKLQNRYFLGEAAAMGVSGSALCFLIGRANRKPGGALSGLGDPSIGSQRMPAVFFVEPFDTMPQEGEREVPFAAPSLKQWFIHICGDRGDCRQMPWAARDHARICRGCWDQMSVPIPIRGPLADERTRPQGPERRAD
jgi:hypothetical protein